MKAVVLERVCTPQELQITEVPIPIVKPGWVLVKIRAFGINRSEMFTRQGHSPSVQFPRIMGIECVGEIEDPSDSTFIKGTAVASLMGGLGRAFDGSYAEYALIPSDQVYPIPRDMKWTELAAIPEMYYTAYASLFECLQLTSGEMLLIRGGTSSVGLAALQLAKSVGATVISTTRDKEKFALLQQAGADYALLDNEHLREQVYAIAPNGVNKVLELVGTPTVKESLQFISERGICCMSGILGNEWTLDAFEPLVDIPTGVYFTAFTSEVIKESTLISLFEHLQKYGIVPPIARVFTLEEIGEAHLLMESNTANGKIVISYEIERGLNMTITENKQLMHRFTNFINTASKELAEELISPDAVFYVPMQKEPMNGPNGYLSIIHMMRSGFSDIQWTVKELVAEEDLIAAHFVMKGTQDGVFLGFPPTGKKIEVNAMNFYRISNGQIIEEYGQPDMLGLLQQIGAIPKA